MANLLSSKLKACTPQYYKLEWDGKVNEPIRHKINTPNLPIEILNNVWIDILEKYTGSISILCDKYTRLNVNHKKDTIAILVYPNGTIMYQGNTVVSWADRNLENICKQVQLEIKNKEQYTVKYSEKDLSSHSPTESTKDLSSQHSSNSSSENELHSSQNASNNPTILEPLDLSISKKDSTSTSDTKETRSTEKVTTGTNVTTPPQHASATLDKQITSTPSTSLPLSNSSKPVNLSSSLEISGMELLSETEHDTEISDISSLKTENEQNNVSTAIQNLSPSENEQNNVSTGTATQNQSPTANKSICMLTSPSISSKENCKRSLKFDKSNLLQDVETPSNQRYPARLSITPDPSSFSLINYSDSFRNMIPLSGIATVSPSKTPTHPNVKTQADSEISVHSRNEEMIMEIQKLKQDKSELELEIKLLNEKLKYHEDTTAILQNISKQKTERHRLEHRSPNIVIKEFGKLEEVLKETRQKLYDCMEEKKQLNQQIILLKKSPLANKIDVNKNADYLRLKSDHERLCGRHKILETMYEGESNKYKNNISKLTEECTNLNTKLKVERKTNENMQDALDLANEKIEDMSTGQQGLYDKIADLKQTISTLQNEITNTRSSINAASESVDTSGDIDERFVPVLRSPHRKTKSNFQSNQRNAEQSHPSENCEQINNRRGNQIGRQQQFSQGEANQQFVEINGYQQTNTNHKSFWIRGDQQANWENSQPLHYENHHQTCDYNNRNQQSSSNPDSDNGQNVITVVQNRGIYQHSLSHPEHINEQNFIPVIQNRNRNFRRSHNSKKYNHPICPFLRYNYCPSERCVYFHPKNYSRSDRRPGNNQYRYISNERYINRNNETNQNQRYNTRNITCKFFLQNRCLYDQNCNYKHPGETQYP